MALPLSRTKILFAVIVILLGVGLYIFLHAGEESTDDAAIEAHVVTISPKVSGYVKALHIEDNQVVKAGDLMVEIDPIDYEIRRDRAKAAVDAAEHAYKASGHSLDTTLISAPSNMDAALADVNAAEANWHKTQSDLKRMEALSNEARSREQLDAAVAAEQTARSNLENARAKLRAAQTAPKVIAQAKSSTENVAAQVEQARADLAQAEEDLKNTKVYAGESGRITKRGVEQGDYIQPGQQLGFIVGSDIWIVANFKETQLAHMHAGDSALITFDAFPSLKVKGKVDSVQAGTGARFSTFPPENATGNFVKIVQRVPVKILLDSQIDANVPAGPGMSVIATVYTK